MFVQDLDVRKVDDTDKMTTRQIAEQKEHQEKLDQKKHDVSRVKNRAKKYCHCTNQLGIQYAACRFQSARFFTLFGSAANQERNRILSGATDKAKLENTIEGHLDTIDENTVTFAENLYNREKVHLMQK